MKSRLHLLTQCHNDMVFCLRRPISTSQAVHQALKPRPGLKVQPVASTASIASIRSDATAASMEWRPRSSAKQRYARANTLIPS